MANENTKLKILNTALRLFSEKGYDAVGVQEIADECHVTKPALYYHFNSKRGILEGIMQEFVEPFIEKLNKEAEFDGDVHGTLLRFACCYLESSCKNMPLAALVMSMQYAPVQSEFYQVFVQHCSKIFDLTVLLFVNAKEKLGNMNGRERQFAVTFLGILSFYYFELKRKENPVVDRGDVDLMIHQFLHGIFS